MATSEVELPKEMATGLEAKLTEALEETAQAHQASRGMGIHPFFMSSGRRMEAFKEMLVEPGDLVIRDWTIDIESQLAIQDVGRSRQAALFSKLVAGNVGRKILGRDNAAAPYWRETCAALNVFGTDDEPPGTHTSDWATRE